jgi:ABC-2 type transport system permease protein
VNLWKLEWLRLFRTRRIIGLVGVYVFFGLLGPLTARYMEQIVESFGGGIEIVIPDPVAADGITSYVANAAQIGLLVSVGIAAAALAFDAKPQMGIFLRTRVRRVADILLPRFVVVTAAVVVSFVLGSIAALYESVVLIGSLSISGWALGTLLGCIYLVFTMAVVAAVAAKARSVLFIVMISVGILLALPLPLLSIAPEIAEWLPSHLVGAVDGLVRDSGFSDYMPSVFVTLLLTTGLLWSAVRWAEQREL